MLTLNIEHGLWVASIREPYGGLRAHLLEVFTAYPRVVFNSHTDTWVFKGKHLPKWKKQVYKLAQWCNEDSIAVWNHDSGKGHIIGPMAEDWGPFRISMFTHIGDFNGH